MFKINNPDVSTPYWLNFPGGVCAPIIKVSALQKSLRNSKTASDYEHVTNYIFNNQKKFKILYFLAPDSYKHPNLEFILDTYDDFLFLKRIQKSMPKDSHVNQAKAGRKFHQMVPKR